MAQPDFQLSGWEVSKQIGKGHAGDVYKCKSDMFPRAAVKVVRLDKFLTISRSKARKRMCKEVDIMKSLNHRNIVRPLEVQQSKKDFALIMTYAKGSSLIDSIPFKGFPEHRVVRIMQQLLNAVHHMHHRNIVHGDLKPDNLIIDVKNHDRLKVTDFGFSQQLSETGCALALGWTACYAPPECHVQKAPIVNKKYDIWSCGIIMCMLLSGTFPLTEENFEAMRNNEPVNIEISLNCSQYAVEALGAMLQVDCRRRLSAEEILNLQFFQTPRSFLV